MIADRAWVERNLGFDPIRDPPPKRPSRYTLPRNRRGREDFERELIEFDFDSPAGLQFLAFSKATGLSRFKDIPWPTTWLQRPVPRRVVVMTAHAQVDVLVVTWTVDVGHALSRVLTPGNDSRNDYLPYTHNFAEISKLMRSGCPAVEAQRLGGLLDDNDRFKKDRRVQVRFSHVAGWAQTSKP